VTSCPVPLNAIATPHVVGCARFSVITPGCVRLEYAADRRFVDEPSLFAAGDRARLPQRPVRIEHAPKTGLVTIDTGVFRLHYEDDGRPFHPKNLEAELIQPADDFNRTESCRWWPGKPDPRNLGGTFSTLDGIVQAMPLPSGLLSRDGWHLVDDSRTPLLVDGWWRARHTQNTPPGSSCDWYLFGYGTNYRLALQSLAAVAGPVPLPPRFAFGSWYSRYWPYSAKDYRRIVDEYRDRGYPLDVLVLDMDWHRPGWTGWSWNRELLPDVEELLADLHARHLAVTVNLHPADGVAPHEDAYPQFMRALGRNPDSGETVPFDPWSATYVRALLDTVHEPLEAAGVDFYWLDWQQEIPGLPPELKANLLLWMNRNYFLHTGRGGRRGISFSRWGGLGDHRHPIHFSGDAHTGWEALAFQIPFSLASGNVGLFFWSHDIGGHLGPRNEECYTRWVQWGALSANVRLHSMRAEALDRRPWSYPSWSQRSTSIAFALRAQLMPYIYGSAASACAETIPLLRPLYLDHPEAEKAYQNQHQYLLGRDLLVAPVVVAGVGERRVAEQVVWFPPDALWWHWLTGERFEGGREHAVWSDIDEMPLFARGGVVLPLQLSERARDDKGNDNGMSAPIGEAVLLRVYPGREGTRSVSRLYEDDGATTAYQKGAYAQTFFHYQQDNGQVTIEIGPREGASDLPGLPAMRAYLIELAGTGAAARVLVDGRPARVDYDERRRTNVVTLPARPATERRTVEARIAASDGSLEGLRATTRRMAEAEPTIAFRGDERDRHALMSDGLAVVVNGATEGVDARAIWICDEGGRIDRGRVDYRIVDEGSDGACDPRAAGTGHLSIGAPLRVCDAHLPPLDGLRGAADRRRIFEAHFSVAGQAKVVRRVMHWARGVPMRRWNLTNDEGGTTGLGVVEADAAGTLDVPTFEIPPGEATTSEKAGKCRCRLSTLFYCSKDQRATLIVTTSPGTEVRVWLGGEALGLPAPDRRGARLVKVDVGHGNHRLRVELLTTGPRASLSVRWKAAWTIVQQDLFDHHDWTWPAALP
jgi:hypothetical protein